MLVHRYLVAAYAKGSKRGSLPMTYVPKSTKLILEACNIPDVTFHICNSNSCHFLLCSMIFLLWLGFVSRFAFCSCHAYHIMSSCAFHFAYVFVSCIRAFSPLSVLQSGTPTSSRAPLFVSFHERVLNVLGMDRVLPSGLGIPPVDHLSSFVPFGGRFMLQRLSR